LRRGRRSTDTNFDDQTFNLLFKDDLQEREIAKVLLEHGAKTWTQNETIAAHILSELPDDDLIDNKTVAQLIQIYKEKPPAKYHPDKDIFYLSSGSFSKYPGRFVVAFSLRAKPTLAA
jgi:DNA primase